MRMNKLNKKHKDFLKELRDLKEEEKKLKQKIQALKTIVEDEIDYGNYEFDGLFVEVTERERLIEDKTKIKKLLGEQYDKCKKKTCYTAIYFKENKGA